MSEQTAVPGWQGPDATGAGVRAGLRLAGPHGVAARQEHRALGNHERARRAEGPWCSMRQLDLTPRALSASRGCAMTFWVLDEATGETGVLQSPGQAGSPWPPAPRSPPQTLPGSAGGFSASHRSTGRRMLSPAAVRLLTAERPACLRRQRNK